MNKETFLEKLEVKLLRPAPDLRYLSAEQQYEKIMARAADMQQSVVTPDDLLKRLRIAKETATPLTVKFGIDPTGPNVHIGHAVSLINLRLFQRMGHKIILVIGDFTAMIGDPSGRMDARPALSAEEVRQNMATYEEQASRIVDLRDPSIERHYNSEWMNRLSMQQWVKITKQISVNALLQREDFRTRLAQGFGLSVAELEYALFMGYDSVVLNPDVEIGGVDQYLNMHMCRQMMANSGQKPEIIITYNLLPGTTGEQDEQGRFVKMSKSRGNYIPVTADPRDMYGKVMSIPDEIMWIWYRELTEISPEELSTLKELVNAGKIHPKVVKELLASAIVGLFNHFDQRIIREAKNDFDDKFSKRVALIPKSTEHVQMDPEESLLETLGRITKRSKSDIRRLARQNGIRIFNGTDYVPITVDNLVLPSGRFANRVVRIGKRHYYKLQTKVSS